MVKKLIAAIILIAILSSMAYARAPQKGDQVRLVVGAGLTVFTIEGAIADISNGLICLNSSAASAGDKILWNTPRNVCIGTGAISELFWMDEDSP
jgi:hypothetical protein